MACRDLSDKNFDNFGLPPSVIGITETNGLPMGDADLEDGIPPNGGLYTLMCRANHSCRYNLVCECMVVLSSVITVL